MPTLGAELTTVGPGVVEIRLPFSPKFTQQNGYPHAGAIIAVLDSACGYAALSLARNDRDVLTAELKANLLAPASGEVLIASHRVIYSHAATHDSQLPGSTDCRAQCRL